MTVHTFDAPAIGEARARGGVYALLASAWRYPDEETVSLLRDMAQRLSEDPDILGLFDAGIQQALDLFTGSLLQADDKRGLEDDMRKRYAGLFGHAVRGACPLYEQEYGRGEIVQQASELADIAGFYQAFGLEPSEAAMERIDHVSVECEFMSVLCAKEAFGLQSTNAELSDTSNDGQRTFLRDHLAQWLPAFCTRVSKTDSDGSYARAAALASAFLEAECRRFGITAGPTYVQLRPVDSNADVEISCGGAAPGDQLVPLTIEGG